MPLDGPRTQDIGFGFYDPTNRLTTAEVESVTNTVLADVLTVSPRTSAEHVPWILTLNAGIDRSSRAAITDKYRALSGK